MKKKKNLPVKNGSPVFVNGKQFLGIRDKSKVAAIFAEIEQNKKAATILLVKTARAYYDAGNIINNAIRNWNSKWGSLSAKTVAKEIGYSEKHITLSLKIFNHFENNPGLLKNMELRDALKLIAPPPPAGEEGYNRVDLGGDPKQAELDFGDLFKLPSSANGSLKNYRTVGDLISEIIVVRRTADNQLTTKRFARFFEDIPQDTVLRSAFLKMSKITQAAIEDYLAALEQEEKQ